MNKCNELIKQCSTDKYDTGHSIQMSLMKNENTNIMHAINWQNRYLWKIMNRTMTEHDYAKRVIEAKGGVWMKGVLLWPRIWLMLL